MSGKKVTIGIDLGATDIKYGIADKKGRILTVQIKPTPSHIGRDAVLESLTEIAIEMIDYANKRSFNLTAIGIGSPGGIDIVNGIVLGTAPNIPDWPGTNIKSHIEEHSNLPCFVDNDANMFLLGEHKFGAARGFKHIVGLTLGTGIGGALILNSEIYRGCAFVGAEIGHMPIVVDGWDCGCGLKGHLEAYGSTDALIKFYRRQNDKVSNDITPKWIFDMAKSGDSNAEKAIDSWSQCIATGIGAAVNLLNPELVLIGGGISQAGSYLGQKIESCMQETILPLSLQYVELKLAELGNKAGWLGASALAADSN